MPENEETKLVATSTVLSSELPSTTMMSSGAEIFSNESRRSGKYLPSFKVGIIMLAGEISILLGDLDSNQDKRLQRALSYH